MLGERAPAMGDELAEILAEVRALRVEQRAMQDVLDRIDRDGAPDRALITAIAASFPDSDFTAAELIEGDAPDLLPAIEAACGRISTRVLGRKLVKLSKINVAGCWLELLSEGRSGKIWRLRRLRV